VNNYLKINMKSKILPEYAEKLEDELLKFFTEKDIIVDILHKITTKPEIKERNLQRGILKNGLEQDLQAPIIQRNSGNLSSKILNMP